MNKKIEPDWQVDIKTTQGFIIFQIEWRCYCHWRKTLSSDRNDQMNILRIQRKLLGCNNQKISCLVFVTQSVSWGDKTTVQNMHVGLLGKQAIQALDMVKLNTPTAICCQIHTGGADRADIMTDMMIGFPQVFTGLGCMKCEPIHIELQPEAIP